ncbi:MAG: outer membrane protein transport protein [Labilithrix sp.]|nr:outer membrane protein transport protein [Labilithrix sp.]MCW5814462.1 outer membrane protein transport protein [Labilithrix sp.]
MKRAAALAVAALLVPALARANPPDTYGFGSREVALGGAAAAETRGVAAGYYNPAALARSRGLELSLGYFHAAHAFEMNGQGSEVDPVRGIVGGLVVPGKVFHVPVAFGVALHLPNDRLARTRSRPQDEPRWELYDNRNQRLFFAANVAIEPLPWLQIGGGISFVSATTARLDVTGSADLFRSDDSALRHEVDASFVAVRYPQLGVRVALSERIALAMVYRGEVQQNLDLRARLKGDVSGLTTALYELESRSVSGFVPQQVVLGGSWALTRRTQLTFDLTWVDWSAYVAPASQLDAVLDIPPPAGGWPSTIAPPTPPPPSRVIPLRLRDRVVPRAGVEWEPARGFFVRAGYAWMKSPIEAQSGFTTYVDRDLHTLALGGGLAVRSGSRLVPGTLSVDAHAQVGVLPEATTRKASPADFVGDFRARGDFLNLGLTATFAFGRGREEEERR